MREAGATDGHDPAPQLLAELRAWGAAHGATGLHKGPLTLVAAPDGEA